MVPEKDSKKSKEVLYEDFLKEIKEYKYEAKTCDESENTADFSLDGSNAELDNLYQEVEEIKQELEAEKEKVKNLEETIEGKNKLIESLHCQMKKEDINKRPKGIKCRYWNRGFCKEGRKCQFTHPERDCQKFLDTDTCEERGCENRHRRKCRYYKTQQGCYRKEKCQYIHNEGAKENNKEGPECEVFQEEVVESFNCDNCSFTSNKKLTMSKHVNTHHGNNSFIETVSNFIFRLALEEYAQEYKDHFKKYGYTREEAQHVEKMIYKYGVDYIMKPVAR